MRRLTRAVISVYAGVAFAVLTISTTIVHPLVFDLLEGSDNNYWPERPEYPMGYWVALVAILLIAAYYLIPNMVRKLPEKNSGFASAVA